LNIITKRPKIPCLYSWYFLNFLVRTNIDLGYRANFGKKVDAIIGVNYFSTTILLTTIMTILPISLAGSHFDIF
jgi:hypothetical protein